MRSEIATTRNKNDNNNTNEMRTRRKNDDNTRNNMKNNYCLLLSLLLLSPCLIIIVSHIWSTTIFFLINNNNNYDYTNCSNNNNSRSDDSVVVWMNVNNIPSTTTSTISKNEAHHHGSSIFFVNSFSCIRPYRHHHCSHPKKSSPSLLWYDIVPSSSTWNKKRQQQRPTIYNNDCSDDDKGSSGIRNSNEPKDRKNNRVYEKNIIGNGHDKEYCSNDNSVNNLKEISPYYRQLRTTGKIGTSSSNKYSIYNDNSTWWNNLANLLEQRYWAASNNHHRQQKRSRNTVVKANDNSNRTITDINNITKIDQKLKDLYNVRALDRPPIWMFINYNDKDPNDGSPKNNNNHGTKNGKTNKRVFLSSSFEASSSASISSATAGATKTTTRSHTIVGYNNFMNDNYNNNNDNEMQRIYGPTGHPYKRIGSIKSSHMLHYLSSIRNIHNLLSQRIKYILHSDDNSTNTPNTAITTTNDIDNTNTNDINKIGVGNVTDSTKFDLQSVYGITVYEDPMNNIYQYTTDPSLLPITTKPSMKTSTTGPTLKMASRDVATTAVAGNGIIHHIEHDSDRLDDRHSDLSTVKKQINSEPNEYKNSSSRSVRVPPAYRYIEHPTTSRNDDENDILQSSSASSMNVSLFYNVPAVMAWKQQYYHYSNDTKNVISKHVDNSYYFDSNNDSTFRSMPLSSSSPPSPSSSSSLQVLLRRIQQRVVQLIQQRDEMIRLCDTSDDTIHWISYELYCTYDVIVNDTSRTWSIVNRSDNNYIDDFSNYVFDNNNSSSNKHRHDNNSIDNTGPGFSLRTNLLQRQDKRILNTMRQSVSSILHYRESKYSLVAATSNIPSDNDICGNVIEGQNRITGRKRQNDRRRRRVLDMIHQRTILRQVGRFLEADAIRRELWHTYNVGVNDRLRQFSFGGTYDDYATSVGPEGAT